jgi:hypothetical protein
MQSKYPLKAKFSEVVVAEKMVLLSRFFHKTLSVQDAACSDLIDELEELKEDGCADFDRICGLYEYLEGMTADQSFDQLR